MIEYKGKYNKDCKVFCNSIEEEAESLIRELLDNKAFENVSIRCMPDCHAGKSIVIGFTSPITDRINPSWVGVDISCAVTTLIFNKPLEEKSFPLVESRIRNKIPFGFNIHDRSIIDEKDFFKFIRTYYDKMRSMWPQMVNEATINEKFISDMLRRIHMDEGVFYKGLGTVGGGNHFIELGDYQGVTAVTIHCGSRNFGLKIANYWTNIANSGATRFKKIFKEKLTELKKNVKDKRELATLIPQLENDIRDEIPTDGCLHGEDMIGYISDMVIASAYALYNHLTIERVIRNILLTTNGSAMIDKIQSIHNYIDFEDHMIRKGAIRSYEGERMIVPFNMRDGIAICEGKSNKDWNCSCSHGAGRQMSRNMAKKNLSLDEFKDQMKDIYSTSVCQGTIDEAPNAYKPTEEIIDAIKETCTIIEFVKPLINLKAID